MLSLAFLQISSEAASQAARIVGVSLIVVLLLSAAAFIAVHFLKKSMMEGSSAHAKDSVFKAQAELVLLAKKKKVDGERADEMAQRLAEKQVLDAKHAEKLKAAQESARETLLASAEGAIGTSCPHCQIEMLDDEALAVCAECGKAQHSVCFSLGGCANGCKPEYVFECPEGKFRDLAKPN